MAQQSAGILLYRFNNKNLEVLLVHPGGPFFAHKDMGAWSIPKGEIKNEDAQDAAKREFQEETGHKVKGKFIELSPQKLKSGKVVYAWAIEGEFDPKKLKSNSSKFGWPEVDRAEWFHTDEAVKRINPGQVSFIKELIEKLFSRK